MIYGTLSVGGSSRRTASTAARNVSAVRSSTSLWVPKIPSTGSDQGVVATPLLILWEVLAGVHVLPGQRQVRTRLEYEGLREKYLPEIEFRGKISHRNSQYARYAAAALRGGVLADLYADAGWWRGDLWQYALYAVVAYVRASAERRGNTVADVARALADAREVSINS